MAWRGVRLPPISPARCKCTARPWPTSSGAVMRAHARWRSTAKKYVSLRRSVWRGKRDKRADSFAKLADFGKIKKRFIRLRWNDVVWSTLREKAS